MCSSAAHQLFTTIFLLLKKQQQWFECAICCHDKQSETRSIEMGNGGSGHFVLPAAAEYLGTVDLLSTGCLAAAFSSCIIYSYIFNVE